MKILFANGIFSTIILLITSFPLLISFLFPYITPSYQLLVLLNQISYISYYQPISMVSTSFRWIKSPIHQIQYDTADTVWRRANFKTLLSNFVLESKLELLAKRNMEISVSSRY